MKFKRVTYKNLYIIEALWIGFILSVCGAVLVPIARNFAIFITTVGMLGMLYAASSETTVKFINTLRAVSKSRILNISKEDLKKLALFFDDADILDCYRIGTLLKEKRYRLWSFLFELLDEPSPYAPSYAVDRLMQDLFFTPLDLIPLMINPIESKTNTNQDYSYNKHLLPAVVKWRLSLGR